MREIIPPLNFTHQVGRKHGLIRCAIAALCLLSIAPLPLSLWLKALGGTLIILFIAFEWQRAKRLSIRLQQDGGGEWHFANLEQKLSPARIVGNPFVSGAVVILRLRRANARWFERSLALQIFKGDLPADTYRQLCVRLKHPPRPRDPQLSGSGLEQRDA